jgi:hypothetical protein
MKKLSVLIALVLLAVAGTGYAVTCAYDNVPAATLLVPYFKVSLNGATGFPIPSGGTDTLVSIVNVSTPGVIAHVTVWNKYSKAVIDFNLPLTGKDVVSFSMRDIMNGRLSPNFPQCDLNLPPADLARCQLLYPIDPCGLVDPGLPSASYEPSVGFGQTQFIRFSHPDSATLGIDVVTSISQYNLTSADAIGAGFRGTVWNSLDESGDVTSFTSPGAAGGNVLDKDNPACGWTATSPLAGALSGYLTIDVVNYCTNFFPDQGDFYDKDAIATAGWGPTYTPNVLIGDVFYVDTATQGGNISGDPAVPVEFDSRLTPSSTTKTFFGKYVQAQSLCAPAETTTAGGCTSFISTYAPAFQFGGDGREPLGDHYGFRFLADSANGLQSWLLAWRSDWYGGTQVNLCTWLRGIAGSNGFNDPVHQLTVSVFDNDENFFQTTIPGGPSGDQGAPPPNLYLYLESQRVNLLAATDWNQGGFKGGWIDVALRGPGYDGVTFATGFYNMGWIGVQHTAPGAFISVGHAASSLSNQFQCQPAITFGPGNQN